MCYILKKSVL